MLREPKNLRLFLKSSSSKTTCPTKLLMNVGILRILSCKKHSLKIAKLSKNLRLIARKLLVIHQYSSYIKKSESNSDASITKFQRKFAIRFLLKSWFCISIQKAKIVAQSTKPRKKNYLCFSFLIKNVSFVLDKLSKKSMWMLVTFLFDSKCNFFGLLCSYITFKSLLSLFLGFWVEPALYCSFCLSCMPSSLFRSLFVASDFPCKHSKTSSTRKLYRLSRKLFVIILHSITENQKNFRSIKHFGDF